MVYQYVNNAFVKSLYFVGLLQITQPVNSSEMDLLRNTYNAAP